MCARHGLRWGDAKALRGRTVGIVTESADEAKARLPRLTGCHRNNATMTLAGTTAAPPAAAAAAASCAPETSDDLPDTGSKLSSAAVVDPPCRYPEKVTPRTPFPRAGVERTAWGRTAMLRSPLYLSGTVIAGQGRGGALLGIPTANVDLNTLRGRRPTCPGIYFGWAKTAARLRGREELRSAPTHGMVMSCGYAPYYDNAEMTIEPHIFAADLPEDFRGWDISLCIAGFIRAESNYPRFGHLVAAIQNDCEVALDALQGLERPTDAGDCSGWIEAPIQYAG
eukprot:GHVU01192956.1.p1 GENE.GHVU01192956.1~~GHVU01192956.1.p1  ORF type:complete len:323 (-),score=45.19 GHVU01192956.1:1118-1963(-)